MWIGKILTMLLVFVGIWINLNVVDIIVTWLFVRHLVEFNVVIHSLVDESDSLQKNTIKHCALIANF